MPKNSGAGEGKGSSKTPLTSDEQDAIRRAKKKARKSCPKPAGAKLDAVPNLNQGLRRLAAQDRAKFLFRQQQVELALGYNGITALSDNSLSKVFTQLVIVEFNRVKPPRNAPGTRTKMAIASARKCLGEQDLANNLELQRSEHLARRALTWAYDQAVAQQRASTHTYDGEPVSA